MMFEIGAAFDVRMIVPSDAMKYRSILQRTSAEDRYCRFFHSVDTFSDNTIEQYVGARGDTVGLIAEKNGMPLGVGHAFFIGDGVAEIALLVANDAQRQGVGRRLLAGLVAALEQRRCRSVIAYSLAQNGAFGRLAAAAGMRPGVSEGAIVPWTLSLSASALARTRPVKLVSSTPFLSMRTSSGHPLMVAGSALRSYRSLLNLTQELLAASETVRRPAIHVATSTLEQAGTMQHCYTRLLLASLTRLESASLEYSVAAGNAVTHFFAAAYGRAGTIAKGQTALLNRWDETLHRPAA